MKRDQFGQVTFAADPLTASEHAISIETRNLNIDKHLGGGTPPSSTVDYGVPLEQVRSADIATLKAKGPDFWDAIKDPQTKAYLERLRDSGS